MPGFNPIPGNPTGHSLEAGQLSLSLVLNNALEFALIDWAKLTRAQRAQPLSKGDEILDILLELRGPVVGVLRLRAARLLGRELAVFSTGAPEAWDFPEAALYELAKQAAEVLVRLYFDEPDFTVQEPSGMTPLQAPKRLPNAAALVLAMGHPIEATLWMGEH